MKDPKSVIGPKDIRPKGIKDFPDAIERSEKLRRESRNHAHEIAMKMKDIEYDIFSNIENETITITKGIRKPVTEIKKKYKSLNALEYELNRRLHGHEEYQKLKQNFEAWKERSSEWASHAARLRRELR